MKARDSHVCRKLLLLVVVAVVVFLAPAIPQLVGKPIPPQGPSARSDTVESSPKITNPLLAEGGDGVTVIDITGSADLNIGQRFFQGHFAEVQGVVLDEQGKPVKGIIVEIRRLDAKGDFKVLTNRDGYSYTGLPSGNYLMAVVRTGEVGLGKVVTLPIDRVLEVNFDLKAFKAAGKVTVVDELVKALRQVP